KELQDAKNAISTLGGILSDEHHLELVDQNGNREERYLFIIRKTSHTPNNFPRQYAQILKKPL
ncbi:MAG: 16S rRNA (guanine(527)-N(7))-methyltransferase RsmG, partial [Clostridia bacterium]|nr:16S rRNA (guanine(527)-N(7))-methyltransferase RsmG [Clostridia bacterium]